MSTLGYAERTTPAAGRSFGRKTFDAAVGSALISAGIAGLLLTVFCRMCRAEQQGHGNYMGDDAWATPGPAIGPRLICRGIDRIAYGPPSLPPASDSPCRAVPSP